MQKLTEAQKRVITEAIISGKLFLLQDLDTQ